MRCAASQRSLHGPCSRVERPCSMPASIAYSPGANASDTRARGAPPSPSSARRTSPSDSSSAASPAAAQAAGPAATLPTASRRFAPASCSRDGACSGVSGCSGSGCHQNGQSSPAGGRRETVSARAAGWSSPQYARAAGSPAARCWASHSASAGSSAPPSSESRSRW
eukprot:2855339-Prymnesium_polylepis.1